MTEQPRPTPEIIEEAPEAPLVDVMAGAARRTIKLHDHGFISLVDAMPRLVPEGQTADCAIVQAARVSYGAGTKKVNEDRGLIRYLLRHRHTTPFEMVEFKFHVAMPIFVARQWIRHRTANVNEYSGRYSVMPDRFYRVALDEVRKQSAGNRQGGEEAFWVPGEESGEERGERREGKGQSDEATKGGVGGAEGATPEQAREFATAQEFVEYLDAVEALYARYESLIEKGASRELARIGLPTSQYTQWYWKCDLHNILSFLALRMDSHAQKEIRDYADAMCALIEPIVPVAMEAWRDYHFGALRLTRLEIDAVRNIMAGGDGQLATENKRERAEWDAKRRRLGLDR